MNIPALKAIAPAVRRQLIEAVTLQLNHVLTARTPDYLDTYASQVRALRELAQADRTGLIERVAYTWFNRFTALRFLDARGWHPFGARVLTPATPDETQPELLKLVRAGHCPEELQRHTSLDRLNGLLDGGIPSNDPQGEVYRHLVLAACRFYNALLPDLFERLDDETELLLPDDLLTEHSIVQGFRSEITDEDCSEVEMLGWLYQFYISEKKDQVMARKAAVPTADIPAVTQLFTPHWIVRYLVENSLGRLWLLNRPDSLLRAWMPYYIEGEPETDFLRIARPEDIRICDPAVGSGHMLTYAFDLLFVIYEEEGYAPNEIPALILRHNLHGLDICPRAAQIAEMALVFKAREKSSQFFQPGNLVHPCVVALRNVQFAENELRGYIEALRLGELFNEPMLRLLHQFEHATTFGSLIQPCLDEQQIAFARGFIEVKDLGGHLFLHETHQKVLRVLEQAEMLTQRYQVVAANPPYMGGKGMNGVVKQFMEDNFEDYKSDLFAAFIVRSLSLALFKGSLGFMSPFVLMFLSSYEKLREYLISHATISTLVQLQYSGFDGATVPICIFTLRNKRMKDYRGSYIRLSDFRGSENQGPKTLEAINNPECGWHFRACADDFRKIPGLPIAYWASELTRAAFAKFPVITESANLKKGLETRNNALFVRLWHEVGTNNSGYGMETPEAANASNLKWFPFDKGGGFRKWYGNNECLVNWKNNGIDIHQYSNLPMTFSGAPLRAKRFYFQPGITWGSITSSKFSIRWDDNGFIPSNAGMKLFAPDRAVRMNILGLLNSTVADKLLSCLSETLNFDQGVVARIPLAEGRGRQMEIAQECINSAKNDWDNFETSWDFGSQPLLRSGLKGATLDTSWRNWQNQSTSAIRRMQELETENNRLFIEAYGFSDELTPDVPEEQITLARADARRDMAAFLSYAVGCMMGRYSLNHPGLILANAGESIPEYLAKVGLAQDQLTFAPDKDGIIPVLDGEWFEDDVVARTREFLRATFGEGTLRENIRFIEESIGRELRSYFLTDFYKDHLQTYKKRPIYWMIQSPRKGFSVLIYLHRYTRDTMNLVLNRYLREYQVKLRSRIAHLAEVQTSGAISTRDKTAARKEFDKLTKTLHECEEWERQVVLPLAQARIELDLDDGVKVNYLKLGEALAPIPGLAAAED
jgi:type II restriction/modification system DNA methylase subunit YeeA